MSFFKQRSILDTRTEHTVHIPYRLVIGVGVGYLVLPICIFFVTWLRWYIGFPAAFALLAGVAFFMRNTCSDSTDKLVLPLKHFLAIAVLLLLWVWTTGIGNFFVSAYDHPYRTALFRDLINFDWPVIYSETGNALIYYLFYWMIPALFGKVFGWATGNVVLLLWTYIGVLLAYLLLLHVCKSKTNGEIWLAAILLFGWSGLNTVGSAITQILNMNLYPFGLGSGLGWLDALFNGYSFNFFYRSNMETLTQIYNQATPLWIITLLTLDSKNKVQNFAFLGLCLLPFAPLPFLGLVIFLIAFFCVQLHTAYKNREIVPFIKQTFSLQNILASITIFPVTALFFSCNLTTHQDGSGGLMLLPLELFDKVRTVGIILFWILQFGIIAALIFTKYRKSILYYITIASLIVIPLFEFGKRGGRYFCMNVSLPALFILMVLTIRYLNEHVIQKNLGVKNLIICVVLTLSILSPIQDIAAKLDTIGDLHQFPVINDSVVSFSDKQIGDIAHLENFLVPNYDRTAFFKYVAR